MARRKKLLEYSEHEGKTIPHPGVLTLGNCEIYKDAACRLDSLLENSDDLPGRKHTEERSTIEKSVTCPQQGPSIAK